MVGLAQLERRDEVELLVRALRDQDLLERLELDAGVRVRSALDRRPLQRQDQRSGRRRPLDPEHLTGLEVERVGEDELRETGVAGIVHRRPYNKVYLSVGSEPRRGRDG